MAGDEIDHWRGPTTPKFDTMRPLPPYLRAWNPHKDWDLALRLDYTNLAAEYTSISSLS